MFGAAMVFEHPLPLPRIVFRPIRFSVNQPPDTRHAMRRDLIAGIMFAQPSLKIISDSDIRFIGCAVFKQIHNPHTLSEYQSERGAGRPYPEVTATFLPSS